MMGGLASCIDLCPSIAVPCPPGYFLQVFEEAVGSGGVRCSCKRQRCVPDDPAKGTPVSGSIKNPSFNLKNIVLEENQNTGKHRSAAII